MRRIVERILVRGKRNSKARPVHLIITMIKWIRTSRLSMKNSLSASSSCAVHSRALPGLRFWVLVWGSVVPGFGFKVNGSGFRASGFGFRVSGLGLLVLSVGL